ncbi:MAG: chemotaxis protein CheW [Polyangiaceae bacterium]|nr:chemotaxis protein CheW [Polyangiaceae bacterium]
MTENASTSPRKPGLEGKYLSFFLGAEEYGIAILKVREIIGMMPVTPVPGTPSFMQGVINLRGKIIPVIDLRAKFSMPPREASRETCIIVVRRPDMELGIVVDTVSEVRDVTSADTEAMVDLGSGMAAEYFLGICKANGKVRLLLDIDAILSTEDIIELGRR